jgi:cell fate (sporulation/competence/biofilm development) regulator YlbF (YheA/YmcA/DUF963 family)
MQTDGMAEKAKELGRLLGQTPEYQALERARSRALEDRELSSALQHMADMERQIATAIRGGGEPPVEVQEDYERTFSRLQASSVYQGLVAAQANFDKVLGRVNDLISEGIETGAKSRIILPG